MRESGDDGVGGARTRRMIAPAFVCRNFAFVAGFSGRQFRPCKELRFEA
jgi:hypothetical protein